MSPGLQSYIESVGPHRPLEWILSPNFAYSPFTENNRPLELAELHPNLRRRLEAEAQIRREFEQHPTAETYWALGILRLSSGQPVQAANLLEKASGLVPRSARVLNDLAAAYHTRSLQLDRGSDLLLALVALERALEIDPGLFSARFNRLLAYEEFSLLDRAARGWQEFQAAGEPGFDAEILRRRESVHHRMTETWDSGSLLDDTRPQSDRLNIVKRNPQKVRDWVLAQIGIWGKEYPSSRSAGVLEKLESIAAFHQEITGDPDLPLLMSSFRGNTDQIQRLARAHSLYSEAIQAYSVQERDKARGLLREALSTFSLVASPMRYWSRYWDAVCVYSQPDYPGALQLLGRLRTELQTADLGGLQGRVSWMLGLTQFRLGKYQDALTVYQEALSHFERVKERENAAAVHNLIAQTQEEIGFPEEATDHRIEALRLLGPDDSPRRRQQILRLAGEQLLALGSPAAARPLLEEAANSGLETSNPLLTSISYWSRSRLHLERGDRAAALSDLDSARAWRDKIPDPGIRQGVSIDIEMALGRVLLAEDASAALRAFTTALELSRQRTNEYRFLEILAARANTHFRLGDRAKAVADLGEAIRTLDQQLAALSDPQGQAAFVEQARPVFEMAVQLQADAGNAWESLEYVKKSRGPQSDQDRADSSETGTVRQLAEQLSPDMAVVDYFAIDNLLYMWVVERNGSHLISLPTPAQEIKRSLDSYLGSARIVPPEVQRETLAELFRELIGPASSLLRNKKRLVLIPDKFLRDLPFSALFNPASRRYLFEDFEVSIARAMPQASQLEPPTHRVDEKGPKLLAVGDPTLGGDDQRTLSRLPNARQEVLRIGQMFERATVLTGSEASEKRFLSEAATANLIHLAVHSGSSGGFLDAPGFLLAPDPPETDGWLRNAELSERRFPATRLVVLSGCSTARALGISPGQTFGLAGRFLRSGVQAVVASYWEVEDEGTMQLMTEFYQRLRAGQPPASALRAAKIEARKRWPVSSAWTAFEVIGLPAQ